MNKFFGNYKGLVIQNDDPEKIGRVKVFIPEISMTLYKGWNEDKETDKKITYLGGNLGGSFTPEILDRLKKALPWAHVKQPIFGLSSPLFYDAETDSAIIGNDSDSALQHVVTNKANAKTAEQTNFSETSTDDSVAGTSNSSPTEPKTIDALSTILSILNEFDINNYLSCEAANSSIADIVDLTYVANSQANNASTGQNSTEDSAFLNTTEIPSVSSSTVITGAITSETTTTTLQKPDNIASVTIKFVPSKSYTKNIMQSQIFHASQQKESGAEQTIISAFTTNHTAPLTAVAAHAAPIVYTLLYGTNTPISALDEKFKNNEFVPLKFIPEESGEQNGNSLMKSENNIEISAENVRFDGSSLIISVEDNPVIIEKSSLTYININYYNPTDSINLTSERLGELSNLLAEYTTPNYSAFSEVVIPPASILNNNEYNRGGGAGDIFGIIASSLLPIKNILNSQIGGANPESLAKVNHNRQLPEQNDPNKTVGSNLQSKIDGKPPIRPPSQNNKVKGMISIPGIGAHVSVYFDNGNPMYPIIDGTFYTQEDMLGIHDIPNDSANSQSNSQRAQTAINNAAALTGSQSRLGSSAYGNADIDPTTAQEIRNGTLQYSDQFTGAGGAALQANQSVAYNNLPLGTELRITDSNGNPINYNGTNPNGLYRIDDTGGYNVNSKIDFYSGSDTGAYNYYSGLGNINVEVVPSGTIASSNGQSMFNSN